MKAEFELNLDSNGKPCIKFRHHVKEKSLEQKALKIFLDAIKEKGCVLKQIGSHREVVPNIMWEDFEIQIKE